MLEWDVTPANRLVNLYVSDCQIRRVNQNGEMREILVDKAGLSGTATVYVNHQNPLLLFARKSEGYLYGVYCRSAISPDVHYYGLVANKLLDTDIYETEVSFDSIVASLKANKITKITENDFRSWASEDEYDWCNYQGGGCARKQTLSPNPSVLEWPLLRSGDVDDIKAVMGEMQSKYREAFLKQEIEEKFTNFPTFIEKIKSINDQRQPMAIGEIPLYSFYPIDEYREILGNDVYKQALELYNKGELVIAKQEVPHAIIALKTENIDTPCINYNIETLDPTPESERFGELKNLQCQMRNFYLWNDEAKSFVVVGLSL